MLRLTTTMTLLLVGACSLDSNAIAPPGSVMDGSMDAAADASDSRTTDALRDSRAMPDAPPSDTSTPDSDMPDTGTPPDASCTPADETCNGADDDCDSSIDEDTCTDCTRRTRGASTYLFCNLDSDWMTGRADCESRGYRFVSLDDAGEDRWVWSEAKAIQDRDWWFGLHDLNTEGTYEWTDGRVVYSGGVAMAYVNWRGGAPEETEDQDCMELDRTSSDGLWADSTCTITQGYVCEVP
jgi:hypothetical protein